MTTSVPSVSHANPLCVDLDGTLIATDLLWESLISMVKRHPRELWRVPLWFITSGRSGLKHQLARHSEVLPESLPYRTEVLQFLRDEKAAGRSIILATASYTTLATQVADHLGLFDGVIATTAEHNMKGRVKLAAIRERFPNSAFDYLGDSKADLPIWQAAAGAYVVATSKSVVARAKSVCTPRRIFACDHLSLKALIKLLRPHQWSKNALLALPVLLAYQSLNADRARAVAVAFIAFSLCASSVYVVNDILDIADDRLHPTKRNRPFASGKLHVKYGLLLLPMLLVASFGPAIAYLPSKFVTLLAFYLFLSTAYSVYLKRRLLVDVMVLAGLYALRVYAGGVCAGVLVTPWLMAFSGFVFLSLAFAKRYIELLAARDRGILGLSGRSYHVDDLPIIESVGPASGYIAVLVLALYVNSDHVAAAYHHPHNLWLICPLLLYWITRLWFFAKRRTLHTDPVMFALKDRMSWYVVLLSVLIICSSV
jgi:4-hydroxybenzoate polyprenyltransferase